MILGLTFRLVWAVANTVYEMVACAFAGHPHQRWHGDIRRCRCGRTFRP